jgi:tetratricopeptide (TPR) repeat protein
MRIATWTLCDNRQGVIGKCMRSAAAFADVCLLIDTGITDGSIEAARVAAGDKLRVAKMPWPGRFDAARNGALDILNERARELDLQWGIMLDSDEWFAPGVRDTTLVESIALAKVSLTRTQSAMCLLRGLDGSHRERVFRLPTALRFVGPTHEVVPQGTHTAISEICIGSTDRSRAEYQAKFRRDIALLEEEVKRNPTDARWWYYLGQSREDLGGLDREAIEAFERCVALRSWDEQAAWAYLRIAVCWANLAEYDRALDACGLGLIRRPDYAELAWMAGWICAKVGAYRKAVEWCELALVHGQDGGQPRFYRSSRIGFALERGRQEGPYAVMALALGALGETESATRAKRRFKEIMETKEKDGAAGTNGVVGADVEGAPGHPALPDAYRPTSRLIQALAQGPIGKAQEDGQFPPLPAGIPPELAARIEAARRGGVVRYDAAPQAHVQAMAPAPADQRGPAGVPGGSALPQDGRVLYQTAIDLSNQGKWREALGACLSGIAVCRNMPELPWYAAFCAFRQGRYVQAVAFANMAIATGDRERELTKDRWHPPAWHEGPYDVLRFAYREIGDGPKADEAEATYQKLQLNHRQTSVDPYGGWHPEIQGWSSDILPFYARLVDKLPELRVGDRQFAFAEIGVWHGRSVLFLAQRLRQKLDPGLSPPTVVAVDINLTEFYKNAANVLDRVPIEAYQLDSVDAANAIQRQFDVVFIDALHDYANVKRDITAWRGKVRPGGLLCGHDYMHAGEHEGVGRAVDEIFGRENVKVEGTVWCVRDIGLVVA